MKMGRAKEKFFKLSGKSIIPSGWGSYGRILQHGMTGQSSRVNGNLALERTGPYVPPITFPGLGDILLTEEARRLLASSDLAGFTFRPVEKKLIVPLRWELWDLSAPEPPIYPAGNEPERYILDQEHSNEIAAAMGDIWELVIPITAQAVADRPEKRGMPWIFRVNQSTWNGNPIFRSNNGTYLTEEARDWFSERWQQFVSLQECLTD